LPCDRYKRVDVGDIDGLVKALHAIECAISAERKSAASMMGEAPASIAS
jgi:hypothetical protein